MCYRLETLVHDCGNFFTKSEKLVLLSLANRADPKDWICWPSVADTAFRGVLSTRQIHRIQGKLDRIGILTIKRMGIRRTNNYQINSPLLEWIVDQVDETNKLYQPDKSDVRLKKVKMFVNSLREKVENGEVAHLTKADIIVSRPKRKTKVRKSSTDRSMQTQGCPPQADTIASAERSITINKESDAVPIERITQPNPMNILFTMATKLSVSSFDLARLVHSSDDAERLVQDYHSGRVSDEDIHEMLAEEERVFEVSSSRGQAKRGSR